MRIKLFLLIGLTSLALMGCSGGTVSATASPAAPATATTPVAP